MSALKNWYRVAAFALLACALALAGCGKNAEPTKAGEPKPAPTGQNPQGEEGPKPPGSLATAKPDVLLTPQQCEEEASKDVEFLSHKYAGKVVELAGIVDDYREETPGKASLLLRIGSSKLSEHLPCQVRGENLANKVLPSQTVILRTRVPQMPSHIGMTVWEIVGAKGTVPTLTAEEFARELAKTDGDDLKKKYAEQPVIVTGMVAGIESKNEGTELSIGGDKNQVTCWFPGKPWSRIPLSKSQTESLKPGLKVKVFGEYSGGLGGLGQCILLEPAP